MNLNSCIAFGNGEYRPLGETSISILDLGLIHCDSTYDVCHVWEGNFFRLDWHLDRFFQSAQGIRLPLPLNRTEITNIMSNCVAKSQLKNAFVWMLATRGIPKSGNPRDFASCETKFFAYAKPYYGITAGQEFQKPVTLYISPRVRFPKNSMDPIYKSFHWGDLTAAQFESLDHGAETAVLVDLDGNITEGPGFNVFCVKDNVVITPKNGVLEGITRKAIIEICKESKISIQLRNPSPKEFESADEVFLSSTAGGLTPVSHVNKIRIGAGAPGPFTKQLSKLYWEKHFEKSWTTAVKY